ncbi:hypothetical protein BS50DRAFT_670758 [Corynespora cassiicola Philippines]|uniref:Uncharacterized protein n=1 Tax=Corynespora cassiicola Philippines TaxID=1448308 RepID=A0A2T2PAF7_CORCC|nr:hypothetical protein BS50DRAFT_670758 [Corynespora cassiicola Philippines]
MRTPKYLSIEQRLARRRIRKTHPKVLGPLKGDSTSTSVSPFFHLPAELRVMIYKEAMTSPSGNIEYISATKRRPGHFDLEATGANLRVTCHFIALEMSDILLEMNTLVFTDILDLIHFEKRLQQRQEAIGNTIKVKRVQIWPFGKDGYKLTVNLGDLPSDSEMEVTKQYILLEDDGPNF